MRAVRLSLGAGFAVMALAAGAQTPEIGRVKVSKGSVVIERAGNRIAATPGTTLAVADVVRTGADGSVGITMSDNSLLSAGPNSALALTRYAFDSTTHQGRFDATLNRGTLSVVSGKIARQAPDAMTVRTPAAILGVRGTEFVIAAE